MSRIDATKGIVVSRLPLGRLGTTGNPCNTCYGTPIPSRRLRHGTDMTVLPPDWKAARPAMLLDPAVTNLNPGSFGPLPRAVFQQVPELRRQPPAGPPAFFVRHLPPFPCTSP